MKRGWIVKSVLVLLLILLSCSPVGPARAQGADGPVYVVQPGDTLWAIAQRFGVSVDALALANGIADAGQIHIGDRLVIPGLAGISGTLTTQAVAYGETLRSLGRRYQVPERTLARLNRITNPAEVYAGESLILPENNAAAAPGGRAALAPGQSLLELAVLAGANPWTVVATNALSATWAALPGDVLRLPGATAPGPGALPAEVTDVSVSTLPLVQGQTADIQLSTSQPVTLTGSLGAYPLHFFPVQAGHYVALQGLHAMLPPGLYPLALNGQLADGRSFAFSQAVRVKGGDFFYEALYVDPATLDPVITQPEQEQWLALMAPATPQKRWDGLFQLPVDAPYGDCWSSLYGNRRSYNDSDYTYFHTGLDYCGQVGHSIYAAAAGQVVFAGFLTVRGNATVIDHGWGVYTAYMHQSELKVQAGDLVTAGQLIGLVGNTGRVEGPHLHFEVVVGDIQVDPMVWLEQVFP
jgi:murein DD-endopeptidase MepM/ murein hydrolase activator NlpD